jgi:hypothetical protein
VVAVVLVAVVATITATMVVTSNSSPTGSHSHFIHYNCSLDESAQVDFKSVMEEYWEAYLQQNPVSASMMGYVRKNPLF